MPIVTLLGYLMLSVAHHVYIVLDYQARPLRYQWSTGLTALWFVQRLGEFGRDRVVHRFCAVFDSLVCLF